MELIEVSQQLLRLGQTTTTCRLERSEEDDLNDLARTSNDPSITSGRLKANHPCRCLLLHPSYYHLLNVSAPAGVRLATLPYPSLLAVTLTHPYASYYILSCVQCLIASYSSPGGWASY